MGTQVYAHPVFGQHETPSGHVEQKDRFYVTEEGLRHPSLEYLDWKEAPLADPSVFQLAHEQNYVEELRTRLNREHQDLLQIDPDTYAGRHSYEAVRRAAGAGTSAVDAIMAGDAQNAFIIARPPGHHATDKHAMGFCLFNTAAITARHARIAHGCQKIAVVDFDVHHGNGTQDIFWADPDGFFASSHEWPQYPGTGREEETGPHGSIHNAPLPTGSDGTTFRRVWGEKLLPALADFNPDFVVISAGFDAHSADPIGGLGLLEEDFRWITNEIAMIARDSCEGRIVSLLEGGYDLKALAQSAAAHVETLARQ